MKIIILTALLFFVSLLSNAQNLISDQDLELLPTFNNLKEAFKEKEIAFKLDLTLRNLKKVPKKVCQLINLQILEIHFNQIKDLPEDIILLENLQVLKVGYNPNYELMIPILQKMKSLKYVLFHGDLPEEIDQMNIRQQLPTIEVAFYDV
jgi:Leucine-rich repeat (LRR) protein